MSTSVNIEWLNSNSLRAYPLREDAQLIAADGATILPNYLIVDFVMTVAPADVNVLLYLKSVAFVGGFLTMQIVDQAGVIVTTLAIDTTVHNKNDPYDLVGAGNYEDARGRVVLGDLQNLRNDLPDGLYQFASAEFEPCTVRPDIRGVRSLRTGSEGVLSDFIHGNVQLLQGSNILLTYLAGTNTIRIDAIDTTGFNAQCACTDEYQLPTPIVRINGINADDVVIIGDGKCLEVTTSGNMIKIRDTCSQPCCGCPELEFLTTRLDLLQTVVSNLESYGNNIQQKIDALIVIMLGSTKGG